MNKGIKIAIGILVAVILIAALVWVSLSRRIQMNPDGTIGNTAGNLNNSGLFCEYDGTVYFANSYDGGSLYAMDLNEGNLRKLNSQKVRNILAGGKYLYYFQFGSTGDSTFGGGLGVNSFNRCTLTGSNQSILSRNTVSAGQLVNNYVYLLTTSNSGSLFSKTKIDGSENVELADYTINPACAVNGIIYYVGTTNDHALYSLDTATDATRKILNGSFWNPIVVGDFVYYMDVSNNYRLCRCSLTQGVVQVLSEDRVDCFNVGGNYIYYQKNDSVNPQLKCIRTDGSGEMVIAEGNYTNINMTSMYVYFQLFGDEITTYHSPLGSGTYSTFSAAQDAIKLK